MTIRERIRRTLRGADERGDVLIISLIVVVVVVILTSTAIVQSVDSINQSAVATKQVNSTDASVAGIQYETNQLDASAAAGSSTFTCPSGSTTTQTQGSITASYSVEYAVATGTASPSVSSLQPCTGAIALTGGSSYLFESVGTTSSTAIGTHTTLADFYVASGTTYGADTGSYGEALFGAGGLSDSGGFTVSAGTVSADAYGGGPVSCNSGDTYQGNYFASGYDPATGTTTASGLDGGCSITGNVTVNGPVDLTAGTGVGGYVVATGAVTTSGGVVLGSSLSTVDPSPANPTNAIVTQSSVDITDGTVDGDVVAGTTVSTSGGPTVNGNIYAAGNVTIDGGTVNGSIYAGGTVTVEGSPTITGTIYSGNATDGSGGISDDNSKVNGLEAYDGNITFSGGGPSAGASYVSSRSYTCGSSASSCTYSLPSSYPAVATTVPSSASWSYFVSAAGVDSSVQTTFDSTAKGIDSSYQTDGTATTNPSGYASDGSFPFPELDPVYPLNSSEQQAWLDDTSFCTAATASAPCVLSTGGTSSSDYCNVAYSNTPANAECIIQDNDCSLTDSTGLWQLVRNMEVASPAPLPTVIETDCPFDEVQKYDQNAGNSYSAKLYNSLAVIDTAGFQFQTNWGGLSSGTGKTLQFFMIVPYGTPAGTSSSGDMNCGSDNGPDINVASGLTDSGSTHYVEDFLYTPYEICTSGNASPIYGRMYAGQTFSADATLKLISANIVPWAAVTAGGGGGSVGGTVGSPHLECVLDQYGSGVSTLPTQCTSAAGSTGAG